MSSSSASASSCDRRSRGLWLALVALGLAACRPPPPDLPGAAPAACAGSPLRVHFYDVGQGLAALVDLPDGRHVLVDTGNGPRRAGCGAPCREAADHLIDGLTRDLAGAPIDVLWITHPHADHVGGVPEIVSRFEVRTYVDNGRDLDAPAVARAREAVVARGIPIEVAEPGARPRCLAPNPASSTDAASSRSTDDLTLAPIVPRIAPSVCARDPNDCSIGLRIGWCSSSVLFVGDAEALEERAIDPGPATLLQVGHHGSEGATSRAFLERVRPRYAVISSGRPGEGLNRAYCHPRRGAVERLASALGGARTETLEAFDPRAHPREACRDAPREAWRPIPVPRTLWSTSRDGDVTLVTRGDGVFVRVQESQP